jgi:hypothetical protein
VLTYGLHRRGKDDTLVSMKKAFNIPDEYIEGLQRLQTPVLCNLADVVRDAIRTYLEIHKVRLGVLTAAPVASAAPVRTGTCYYCKVDRHAECITVPGPEGKKRTGDNTVDVCDCAACAADGAGDAQA